MEKVRVALVGHGHLGKWHAQKINAHESAEFSCIVEPNENSHEEIKKIYPAVEIFKNLDQAIGRADAFIVATPTSFHFDICQTLIKNDKHIFCEKPLTSTFAESSQLKKMAQEKNLIIQVGHSERFHEAWEYKNEFKQFFEGAVTIRTNRLAPFKGRATDVDVVQDLMIHDLDIIYYLFNKIPVSVEAFGHKIGTSNWDFVSCHLSFENNMEAFLTVGRNHIEEVRNFEVTNDKGCFYVDLFRNELKVANASTTSENILSRPYDKRDHLFIEQDHFYKSILKKSDVVVALEDGVVIVNLIDKVIESLQTQKKVFITE